MKVTGYKCDVCGKAKEAVNHWFIVLLAADLVTEEYAERTFAAYNGKKLDGVIVLNWDEAHCNIEGAKHVCGQDHAFTFVSRWMNFNSFETPPAKEKSNAATNS